MNRTDDDFTGAILFIIVVLFWYSLGIICMLAMHIRSNDDGLSYRMNSFADHLRDQTHTKEILGRLFRCLLHFSDHLFCRRISR